MSQLMEIEIGEKTYKLGFPTRKAAIKAEQNGLDMVNTGGKVLTTADKLFYTGLLAEQPEMDEETATNLLEQYISEGGDQAEITTFLTNEYLNFFASPTSKKQKKKAKIIKI